MKGKASSDLQLGRQGGDSLVRHAIQLQSAGDLAQLLRALRRRHARGRRDSELTYRELAARTGWSHAAIAEYMTGRTLPPTDRLDVLLGMLGVSAAEQSAIATARDRIEELRRHHRKPGVRSDGKGGGAPLTAVRQLPAVPPNFVGRTAELAALTDLIDHPVDVGTVAICVITGAAGMGKTSLAIHWSHQVADRFPDGQLYLSLRGFDPAGSAMDPAQAVRGVLIALGTPPQQIPTDLGEQAALYRSTLAGRRMLIVLDNARDEAQIRPLLPGTAGFLVLVTSRHRLSGLIASHGAHCVALDPLSLVEARQMLSSRLGAGRAARELEAIDDIVGCCGRLPLALAVAAANAATRPQLPLADFVAQLRQVHRRLDVLATGDLTTDLRTAISCSYQALTPEAAALFRLLSLHPGPDIDHAATAALAGVLPAHAERSLDELIRVNLLMERSPHRYAMHDLLRVFAQEQVHAVDSAQRRTAATYQMLNYYLHTATVADQWIHPTRTRVVPAIPDSGMTAFAGYQEALQWLVSERIVLMAVAEYAAQHGFHHHAWQLAWTLTTVLNRQGHWHDWVAVHRKALESIQGRVDGEVEATVHCELARAYLHIDDHDNARRHLTEASEIFQRHEGGVGLADVHGLLAGMSYRQHDFMAAIAHAKAALRLYQANQHLSGQARILNNLGWYHSQLNELRLAKSYCARAILINYRIGQRNNQAASWDSLGFIHYRLSEPGKAIACYVRALELWQDLGNRYDYAITLIHLGDARHATGERDLAEAAWQQGLGILEELNHPDTPDARDHIQRAKSSPAEFIAASSKTG